MAQRISYESQVSRSILRLFRGPTVKQIARDSPKKHFDQDPGHLSQTKIISGQKSECRQESCVPKLSVSISECISHSQTHQDKV